MCLVDASRTEKTCNAQGIATTLVEDFNISASMATVNFSVPEEIKEAFQEAFARENKSAVIARLMQQAVEERRRHQTRAAAIDALLALRREQLPVSVEEIRKARELGRP